jgi:probable HAF family extracellular repeat protein
MRRFVPALLLAASCADAPLEPGASGLTRATSTPRSITNVEWTQSTTGIDLVPIGQFNGDFTMLIDINDNGLAVGSRNSFTEGERAISWQNGVFTDLGTLGGGFSRAHQVNNAGVIVGVASDASGRFRAVVWENGLIRALPALDPDNPGEGVARAINDRGDVVGNDSRLFQTRAVLWPAEGGVVDLGLLPGTSVGWATGINNSRAVFGQSISFPCCVRRATTWVGGLMSEVTLPDGAQPSGADIATGRMFNDAGNFLGEIPDATFMSLRAIVFRGGEFHTLPPLPGAFGDYAVAYGLNQAGDVVGTAVGPFNWRPVLWANDGTLTDLGYPAALPFGAADAHGINNRGYVIGAAHGEWSPGRFGTGAVLWRLAVDVTPPVVAYSAHPATFTIDETIAITCTATDDDSGIATHTCADITGDAYTFGLGTHSFTATATDNAGNTANASTSFIVNVTRESLAVLTRRFFRDHGLANGLVNMLVEADATNSDALNGYRAAVGAHAGKTVSVEHATILIELSKSL